MGCCRQTSSIQTGKVSPRTSTHVRQRPSTRQVGECESVRYPAQGTRPRTAWPRTPTRPVPSAPGRTSRTPTGTCPSPSSTAPATGTAGVSVSQLGPCPPGKEGSGHAASWLRQAPGPQNILYTVKMACNLTMQIKRQCDNGSWAFLSKMG